MLKKTSRAFRLSRGQTSIGSLAALLLADQHDVICERSDLDSAPTDLFDHAGVPLSAHRYHVAHLKRAVRLQRDSGEEVSECVLQRETEDDAEDRRSGKQRAEIYFRKDERESDQKEES